MARSKIYTRLSPGEKPIVDLSRHNGNKATGTRINWDLLAPAISGAIIRVGVGWQEPDDEWEYNCSEGIKRHVSLGAYHAPRANQSIDKQIFLVQSCLSASGNQFPLGCWADWEPPFGASGSHLVGAMRYYMQSLDDALLLRPGIYTGHWCWTSKYLKPYPFWSGTYALWIAYGVKDPRLTQPKLPPGWTRYSLWQYGKCHAGELPGVQTEVDLDMLNPTPVPTQREMIDRLAHQISLWGGDLKTPLE